MAAPTNPGVDRVFYGASGDHAYHHLTKRDGAREVIKTRFLEHWAKDASPPRVGSRSELSVWLCQVHNRINEKLGKPVYSCDLAALDACCGGAGAIFWQWAPSPMAPQESSRPHAHEPSSWHGGTAFETPSHHCAPRCL